MKLTLELLLTTSILAVMLGTVAKTPLSGGSAVTPQAPADRIVIADGTDPMPGCRRCK